MIESNREQLPAYVDQVAVLAITKSRRQNPAPDYNGAALWRRLFFLSLSVTATELEANMALSLSLSLLLSLSLYRSRVRSHNGPLVGKFFATTTMALYAGVAQ